MSAGFKEGVPSGIWPVFDAVVVCVVCCPDILFTYACDDNEVAPVVDSADGVVSTNTLHATT